MQALALVKSLSLVQAVIVAAVAIALGMFIFRTGILNTVSWLVAIGAVAIGAVNKISYS